MDQRKILLRVQFNSCGRMPSGNKRSFAQLLLCSCCCTVANLQPLKKHLGQHWDRVLTGLWSLCHRGSQQQINSERVATGVASALLPHARRSTTVAVRPHIILACTHHTIFVSGSRDLMRLCLDLMRPLMRCRHLQRGTRVSIINFEGVFEHEII